MVGLAVLEKITEMIVLRAYDGNLGAEAFQEVHNVVPLHFIGLGKLAVAAFKGGLGAGEVTGTGHKHPGGKKEDDHQHGHNHQAHDCAAPGIGLPYGVGVLNFMDCMRGAWLNVKINLPGVKDEARAILR